MALVITFNSKWKNNSLEDSIEYYASDLYDKRCIFLEAAEVLKEVIREAGMDPEVFRISKADYASFAGADLESETEEVGETDGPTAYADIDGTLYIADSSISLTGDEVSFNGGLFRLQAYREGGTEWEVFDPENCKWEKGPGEDFFDLSFLEEE